MRILTETPLNAETPTERLRTWITDNEVFFKRNQGLFPADPVDLSQWSLSVEGLLHNELNLSIQDLLALPKVQQANTMECSGNSRSLLSQKASGNPWTVGGVGNAIWGGVLLKDVLEKAGPKAEAGHVAFEGFDIPAGKAGIKFIRSIPMEKALSSTLLAYEMNGEPLPLKHGFPLRVIALGWTGANCVKWLKRITLLDKPFEGFFMDKVYRVFQKGEAPEGGTGVTGISLKAVITQPLRDERLARGIVPIRGAAYAGETEIAEVEVSTNGGKTWNRANLIGLKTPYAWRQWEYLWEAPEMGTYTVMARATDVLGNRQPEEARWNVLGYQNTGIREHAVNFEII